PNPQYIVIHHTVDSGSGGTEEGAKEFAQGIQRFHVCTRGWSDSGHNFLNTVGGFLLEGRHGSLDAVIDGKCVNSAHTQGANESPGIENEGNFQHDEMDDTQWNSLVELCAALCKNCNIDPDNIKGHKDFDKTACPGDNLYAKLPELRKQVRLRL
ncbi:MAG: peptidoglycan recognition protein family protein, partial [Elainellaceae cyanobacterium]